MEEEARHAHPSTKMIQKLTGHTGTVTSIDVSMDKSQFYSGSTDGTVKVWSWEGGNFDNKVTVNAGGPWSASSSSTVARAGTTGRRRIASACQRRDGEEDCQTTRTRGQRERGRRRTG